MFNDPPIYPPEDDPGTYPEGLTPPDSGLPSDDEEFQDMDDWMLAPPLEEQNFDSESCWQDPTGEYTSTGIDTDPNSGTSVGEGCGTGDMF